MKRLILGLIVAVIASLGLVGGSVTTASAACPYSGCVSTRTNADDTTNGKKVSFKANVAGIGTNATVNTGSFVLKVFKANGKRVLKRTHSVSRGKTAFTSNVKFNKGRYSWTISYVKRANSKWGNSGTSGAFVIR